jgi:pimeloyl-CoA synthetase
MDSRNYPQIVRELLDRHAQGKPSFGNIEVETIFDLEHNRYQIVHMGWHHDSPEERLCQRRVHQCVMHIDIRNDKIWIMHNTTEHELDLELIEMGVPKSDIVLGLHPPELRQFTGYAVQ